MGIDLVMKISDQSVKFHIKYVLPTFSYAHEAYIDYAISLTIFEMQHDVSKLLAYRQSNEQTYLRKSTRCIKFHWHPGQFKIRRNGIFYCD